jgi:uncharacterized repeat protein (TIGR02543 family)
MTVKLKVSGSWKNVSQIKIKIGGVWRNVSQAKLKVSGAWRNIFSSSLTPSIQTRVNILLSGGINASSNIMNDSDRVTITSTRFHWEDADGYTYAWQKSPDNLNWEDIGSAQSTTNPASGSSSSSLALTLSPSYFTSGPDMYFRFSYRATNSTYSTSASSESLSSLVSYYGTPVPQSPYPEITGSTTVGNDAFGNIGVWTNSPTSYDYRWFFMSGLTSYPLTFSQSRSVSNKSLSGFTATITTSAPHGYKTSDITIITSMDSLFNKASATISSVTSNSFSYSINPPTAWDNAGTGYSTGTYVSYSGSVYSASSTISSSSPYNGGTMYSSGAIVYSGTNRYQSNLNNNIGNSVTNPIYWNPLGNFAPGGSLWTLQNFSNVAASGTITGPNYYEGTVSSSTSFLLNIPTVDYRSQINMIDKALYFGVKAYNPATPSPSEYSNYKLVYGYPVISIGSITTTATTASIPYTHSYMSKYNIDILFGGTSIGGIYPRTVTSPASPISVTGLTNAPRTYSYIIYPINGEDTYGTAATGTFSTVEDNWTITWAANGGTGGGTTTRAKGLTHTAPSPGTRDGFDFLYYRYPASGGTDPVFVASGGIYTPTEDTTFGAIWTPKTYTVSYNSNGGINSPASQTKTHDVTLTLSATTPTRTNFTFNGWNTASNGSGTNYSAGGSYIANASVTLYAKWTAISYTVAWSPNGGSVSPTSNSGAIGTVITSPTPTRSNHTFLYWRDGLTVNSYVYQINPGGNWTIDGARTFYAWWQIIQYTVTYNANGGSVSPSSQTVNAGSSATLPTPSRSGFTFNGWYTATSGGSFLGLGGTSYTPTSSITIYAQWTAILYTVTWNANGGTVSPTSNSGASGTVVTTPTPTRSGFTFLYWASTASGDFLHGPTAGSSYTITQTISWFARWAVPLPVISSIVARNGGTGGAYKMQYTITSTNTASYTSVIRYGSTTSTVNAFANTHASSTIQTNLGNTINDYYIIELTPWSGAGGTGSAGVMRTTTIKRNTATPSNTTNNY